MQDYFMNNAMKGGWQTPKEIGFGIGLIFDAMKGYPEDKHIYVCAHYEKTNDNDGTVTYQMKTTKAIKTFVKDFDGTFPAKDSIGVLDNMPDEFPNDLFLVSEELKKWYK